MLLLRQFFLFVCTFALYEDQIGKFDWRKELIGYPKIASFEEVSGQSEYVSVYTNLGILASLSARDGKVIFFMNLQKYKFCLQILKTAQI